MSSALPSQPARILVIDDNASIHEVFRKILSAPALDGDSFDRLSASLFDAPLAVAAERPSFLVDSVDSGEAGCAMVTQARVSGSPYAAAFVDMRMPKWDGVTTIEALWRADPNVQIVICTAYSDYTWDEVVGRLGHSDRWLVLKKPFDLIEVQQMAMALAVKWELHQKQRMQVSDLEQQVAARVAELARSNRTLRMISRCQEALLRSGEEQELLGLVCQRLVDDGDYVSACVTLTQHDNSNPGMPAAQAGPEPCQREALQASLDEVEHGCRPDLQAMRDMRPVVMRLAEGDLHLASWRHAALQRGLASVLALPLCAKGSVLGSLCIYSRTADVFDAQEVSLLQELADNVGYGVANLRQSDARERAERDLHYLANFDALTELPNRNLLRDRLRQAIAHAARSRRQVAALVLSLDHYQPIREALGEDASNRLLKTIGERLSGNLRAGDSIAHLTGEEFAIAITDIEHAEEITGIARRLMRVVAQPVRVDGFDPLTTASIGISLSSTEGEDVELLLRNAASAAHCARLEGGNTLHFYAPQMNDRAVARLALETDLRRAVSEEELVMYFQPKANATTGALSGAESLIRWNHPRLGLVMPGDFIPQAEESGMIQSIGSWVIEAVCRQIRRWLDAGIAVLPVAVNVSARQFQHKNLTDIVRHALHSSQVDPALLELEITESALLADLDATTQALHELKALGVKLTLDDFGTGFSSLSNLQHFPVDQVKIDQSFVRNVTNNPSDAAICRSIIELAHALQLRVVGEGVETEGQLNYLRRHRCDELQGYYFSKPIPAAAYETMLIEQHNFPVPSCGSGQERTLLIVDDEPNVLAALQRGLRREGFNVLTAHSALQGLELLAQHRVQVVLSDQRMPHMSGTEFLARVRAIYPDTIRVILSGYADLATVVDAVNRGTLFKFMAKPWDDAALREQIREAFVYHELRAASR